MEFDINPLSPQWQGPTIGVFVALLGLMALDIVVGTWVAASQGRASSAISRNGVTKKVVSILLIAATALGKIVMVQVHPGMREVPMIMMVAAWFALTEMLSIVEHGVAVGVVNPHLVRFTEMFSQAVSQPVPGIPVVPVTPVQRDEAGVMAATFVTTAIVPPPPPPASSDPPSEPPDE